MEHGIFNFILGYVPGNTVGISWLIGGLIIATIIFAPVLVMLVILSPILWVVDKVKKRKDVK